MRRGKRIERLRWRAIDALRRDAGCASRRRRASVSWETVSSGRLASSWLCLSHEIIGVMFASDGPAAEDVAIFSPRYRPQPWTTVGGVNISQRQRALASPRPETIFV